ncbi:methyl-accepting chemotaxis protein [Synechococcus elongatus]|uniref:methyl-accepting chemotaxis protein n=1 Tax=Synechococcus elongatus TaxID=32046 RepID=UPI000F7EDD04|nr:methyl-accepting chemotaxis protein [Synechococcus elongatus]
MTSMASEDRSLSYEQVEQEYLSGHYSEAAELAEALVQAEPQNPRLRLLRGHIFYSLGRNDQARVEYELIRGITPDPDILEQALLGMDRCDSRPHEDVSSDMEGTVIVPIGAALPVIEQVDPSALALDLPPLSGTDTIAEEPSSDRDDGDNPFATDPASPAASETEAEAPAWLADIEESAFASTDESSPEPWAEAAEAEETAVAEPAVEEAIAPAAETLIASEPEVIPEPLSPEVDLAESQPPITADETVVEVDLAAEFAALAEPEEVASEPAASTAGLEEPGPVSFDAIADEVAKEVLGAAETAVAPQPELKASPAPVLENLPTPPNLAEAAAIARQPVTSPLRPQETKANRAAVAATPASNAPKALPTPPKQTAETRVGLIALVSALAAAAVGVVGWQASTPEARNRVVLASMASMAVAGAASAGIALQLQNRTGKRYRDLLERLNEQCQQMSNGDFETPLQVGGNDDVGMLALRFDRMRSVLGDRINRQEKRLTTLEQQREGLQNQVIRLLDDVEGVAHGDLTVQAEVTADVLGAVADSFNLTIQNLREIVAQVRDAALQVNAAATDNEQSAKNLSAEALHQAEELAAALNSVQVMTESIQRVAISASEAESVARAASQTALKGGEAVDKTLSGILRIRETVAETTRKVKKLAESSQEISKIVALISQVASRTNLLALNASIEAARAGQAGRGFAIVADEVRQLADRAAKSSKEIEQIVLKIQSETGLVMTAMEEGTQQVIQGTRLAEQARGALDEIIQVSTKIDDLVQSITADTVQQTAMSRSMAEVMQSVETTAQNTSQEAQQVAASLQGLVNIAGTLRESVDRFRLQASAAKEN